MMRLSQLLENLSQDPLREDPVVRALTDDSRLVVPGALFVAVRGSRADGAEHLAQAAAQGAVAALVDSVVAPPPGRMPVYRVPRLAQQRALIAARFHGFPAKRLHCLGVTGTNGKTTCAHLAAQLLGHAGRRAAVIGTVGTGFPGALRPSTHTTPGALALQQILAELVADGATDVAMEVSSHALAQDRVAEVPFQGALFTNLTRDHLDFHGTMEAYAAAKARLFEFSSLRYAVLCEDDAFGRTLRARLAQRSLPTFGFGLHQGDVRVLEQGESDSGLRLTLQTPKGRLPLMTRLHGSFNALNVAAIAAVMLCEGYDLDQIAQGFREAQPVPGRMERFGGGPDPLVVVDYAHTPDALQKALEAVRPSVTGELWCVFGCGGDRDAGKRPQMGRIASQLCDQLVLTDDNPRSEAPEAIIAAICAGLPSPRRARIVHDRAQAIRTAVREA
ncbi:MAG TPA: UDP-N-acetylmuramoyl-L-alanyl-D-glutamate--2,6-diaminopimelate ligase, partial [Acidiferrobacteraceae bacterium]|nr:UDP-N-acetylmuramoyl-L-alanyl-D-glutamate--2,6-diaminopimelate ligase [Acidiferrobacteraceae bacterium]